MVNGVHGGAYGDIGTGSGGTGKVLVAGEVEERLRVQNRAVLASLKGLQERVGEVVAQAEGERWRRLFVGGLV
jgi:hypothetical protein